MNIKTTWIIVTVILPAFSSAQRKTACQHPITTSEYGAGCTPTKTKVWSYDKQLDLCVSYTYEGCKILGNKFIRPKDCHSECVEFGRAGYSKKSYTICDLQISTQVIGHKCKKRRVWAYNLQVGKCVFFDYEGCGLRGNMFKDFESCNTECHPSAMTRANSPICHLPRKKHEDCKARLVYSYERRVDDCLPWMSDTCFIDGNTFAKYEDCRYQCVMKPSTFAWIKSSRCDLEIVEPIVYGNTNCEYRQVWSYDKSQRHCIERHHRGCRVVDNMFTQFADCVNFCQPRALLTKYQIKSSLEACSLLIHKEIERTKCENGIEVFSYHTETQQCKNWTYYGCEIRGNKFASLSDCETRCKPVK